MSPSVSISLCSLLLIGNVLESTIVTTRPTWGIASLRQTTDFPPGYIAERACREELLDLVDMMTSPMQ
jgi:hypothetical protein